MWLAVALILLVAVLVSPFIWMSPERQSLTYCIIKDALKSVHPWFNPHQVTLLGMNRVMISNKYSSIKMMRYKVYVRIEAGNAIVSNFCQHGIIETKVSMAHVDAISKLGTAIETMIDKHLAEGCRVYDPNYDF